MQRSRSLILCGVLLIAFGCHAVRTEREYRDVVYARVDGWSLQLDLYMPQPMEGVKPPLVVWIHGGGWVVGSKRRVPIDFLVAEGFAVASINYRLAPAHSFPAQIHDCKAAIRWLRAHAKEYGYDADRIGVAGESAGGHLAALLGTTAGDVQLEGDVGGHVDQSSRVSAVCMLSGVSDLTGYENYDKYSGPLSLIRGLLGGPLEQMPAKAATASPVTHVDASDPPFLIFHARNDPLVQVEQSERFYSRLMEAGVQSDLIVIWGIAHGHFLMWNKRHGLHERMTQFFRETLKTSQKP